ncbi:glutamine-rich protein 2-like [Amphiura filiformis]|uniref:glutamine-rich protein 2-like n=1 Tax=Amphiura filiformis TaxID=82378 RepID=UPI003B21C077
MTATTVSLTELVDLSLGTPEVVNYKGLRTLLLAIVGHLKLGDVKTELKDTDKQELLAAKEVTKHNVSRPISGTTTTDDFVPSRVPSPSPALPVRSHSPGLTISQASVSDAQLQSLEHKVSKLENQMEAFNALPSNEDLLQRVKSSHHETTASAGSKTASKPSTPKQFTSSPVTEMWQLMQVQRIAAANEEGVGKLMSMVEDMMRNFQDLKDHLNKYTNDMADLKQQLNKLNSDSAELKSSHEDMRSSQDELKSDQDNINERLSKLESSSANEEKMSELQKLMNDINNRLNTLPPIETVVTWPAMEDALKGIYKEPAPVSDGWIQTNPVTESTQQQTIATSHEFTQTRTPSPPPRPSTGMSSRPGSAISTVSHQPTKEIQKILKDIGELSGKHVALDARVKLLEELMEKKADLEEIKRLLGERQDVPEDLAKMLGDLQDGLDSLHKSKDKMDQLSSWIEESFKHSPATQQDIDELKEHLERIHSQLAEDIDSLINGLPVGRAVSLSAVSQSVALVKSSVKIELDIVFLEKLSDKLQGELMDQSNSLGLKITRYLGPLKTHLDHLDKRVDALGKMRVREGDELMELEEEEEEEGEQYDIDGESITEMQKLILQMQAEVDRLNTTYVQLVDEHNAKQKHIDALYTFVDRLQENKADKEHVTMEIDIKADKRMLENKVSRSQFQGTVDEMTKNLNDVMSKLSGHTDAWESAVSELKLGIDNKLDRMELDPLKAYLDRRIKAVDAKVIKKDMELPEDAAGFRRPLQKFNCISCDRPLDMSPQPPLASLPENKGLPGMRSGRPYTTFELEQIRAAQKKGKPGKNVQHYERALFEHELARQRKQDILAYLVHFEKEEKPPTFCMRGPVQHRVRLIGLCIKMMFASEPETEFLHIDQTPKEIPGEVMKIKHTRQMTEYLKTKTPPSRLTIFFAKHICYKANTLNLLSCFIPISIACTACLFGPGYNRCGSHYGDVPDYFVTTRSCGGSHTMTYPHKRVTRTANTVSTTLTAIVPTEDLLPMKRLETDIQGADGHIYRARVSPGTDMEKLPNITNAPKSPKSVRRTNSARGRRQPPSSAATERTSPHPTSGRPHSARISPRSSTHNFDPATQSNTLEVNMNAPSEPGDANDTNSIAVDHDKPPE